MKKYLFVLQVLLLLMTGTKAYADIFAVTNADGVTIYYSIETETEVIVTYSSGNKYRGVVAIPEEVRYMNKTRKVIGIGSHAFSDCSGLTSVTIPNSVTWIGSGAFYGCSGLTSVTIPNSVTTIGDGAFNGCSALTSITIGNSVKSIGHWAFYNCSGLTSVTIPNSVTSIGEAAFADCSGLISVIVEASTPIAIIYSSVFSNCTNATLYVPAGSKAAYQASDYWKDFKEIVEMEDESNNNTLFAANVEALVGAKVLLPIELTNEGEVKLCQFDLQLPIGVTVATKSNGKLDGKLTGRAENHSISGRELSNGDYRFVISSMDNDSFTGNEGTLMEITLDVSATMEAGEYTVKVMNVELSVPDGNDLMVVRPADAESKLTVKAYTSGDVNNDGSVSVTDVGCAINYILEQVPSVFVFEAADMNGDKSVSVTDVGMIINLILNEGAASRTDGKGLETNYCNDHNSLDIIVTSVSLSSTAEGYELMLEDKDAFIGFQFDVEVAEGVSIGDVRLNGVGESDHVVTYCLLQRLEALPTIPQSLEASPTNGNRRWRVVCYSPTNSVFTADNAPLLTISVVGEASKLCSTATISNIRLTTAGFDELHPANLTYMPTGIASINKDMQMSVEGGTLRVTSDCETTLRLYSLDGSIYRTLQVKKGMNRFDGLRAGIYMINNQKIIVR